MIDIFIYALRFGKWKLWLCNHNIDEIVILYYENQSILK